MKVSAFASEGSFSSRVERQSPVEWNTQLTFRQSSDVASTLPNTEQADDDEFTPLDNYRERDKKLMQVHHNTGNRADENRIEIVDDQCYGERRPYF